MNRYDVLFISIFLYTFLTATYMSMALSSLVLNGHVFEVVDYLIGACYHYVVALGVLFLLYPKTDFVMKAVKNN